MGEKLATTLRTQVEHAWQTLAVARQAGHDYEVHLHGARIRDLLDLAARHGIRTSGWVNETELAATALQA